MTKIFPSQTYEVQFFDQRFNEITATASYFTVEIEMVLVIKRELVLMNEMRRSMLRWPKFSMWFLCFSRKTNSFIAV